MVTLAAPKLQAAPPGDAAMLVTTAVAPVIWGTTYLVTTEFLPPERPLLAATVRALPAGLAIVAGISLARRRATLPSGVWWWRSLTLGMLNIGLFFPLLFVAAYLLPGGVAAIAGAFGPFVVAAYAYPLLRLTPSRMTIVAGLIGVLGVTLVVVRSHAALNPAGLAAAVGGMLLMSLGTVLGRRWGTPPAGLLPLVGWQLTVGGLMLLPVTLLLRVCPQS